MTDFYDEQWAKRFFIHEKEKEQQWPPIYTIPQPMINEIKDRFFTKESPETDKTKAVEVKDQINPPHYQDIVPGMQYMEMMVFMLARFNGVDAHLMGQIYKYLMRAGMKDPIVQDLEKAQWYLNALINQLKTGDIV
jgi:hypothetical protein